ncbi:hypothetical protein BKA61DRAFT_688506 [Leptodontidium sp. MPI-SDFR-AT-0119]|nr:hypothetical protein BKA61DRAFT_688506 [Leptodontidium sp. MPI-SDFR-AT-0119]
MYPFGAAGRVVKLFPTLQYSLNTRVVTDELVGGQFSYSTISGFAITNMNQVIETANKILEQERKNMILNFVTAFLMFIPLAGGAAGSIGGGLLRTIINISGELGNLAVGIYSVVVEPGNALVTIFGNRNVQAEHQERRLESIGPNQEGFG